jgi:uncharacterized protein YkwD
MIMKKYLLIAMLSILFFNAKLLAQPDFQITELPFRNEMMRIDWTSNKAAKPLFDSAAHEVARILENAYLSYKLAICLEQNLELTYYIPELKRAEHGLKKKLKEEHKKSGANKPYNGLKTEEAQLEYLANKRLNNYHNALVNQVSKKFHLNYIDIKASSFVLRQLKKSTVLKVITCNECEERIVLNHNFEKQYHKRPEKVDFYTDLRWPQDLTMQYTDKYALNELTPDETELYHLIMSYRKSLKLPDIPVSQSLNIVAKMHVRDLYFNGPYEKPCNLHSWSGQEPERWRGCCYTGDHKYPHCMWYKPAELTRYKGKGYEIAYSISNDRATAEGSFRGWLSSPKHHAVIKNSEIWFDIEWKAIGIGIYKGYACVWFGEETDEFIYDPIFIDLSSK